MRSRFSTSSSSEGEDLRLDVNETAVPPQLDPAGVQFKVIEDVDHRLLANGRMRDGAL